MKAVVPTLHFLFFFFFFFFPFFCSADKTVRLWSLKDREMLVRKDLPAVSRTTAFSPDGSRLAVGMDTGACLIASASDLNMVMCVECVCGWVGGLGKCE